MSNQKEPKVAIIIVNWNAIEYLKKCLSSIFRLTYSNFEVILIDNGSADGSTEFVRSNFPYVRLVSMDKNYGFAKATNIGIEMALKDKTPYIALLNVDTIVEENFLKELVIVAESDSAVGCCQPKMFSMSGPGIIDAVGITLRKNCKAKQIGYDEQDIGKYDQLKEVFGVNAGAALYKSEMLEQIGLFEEECFAYYEDVDLALRVRLAGWKCMYVPQAVVYHKQSITYGKKSPIIKYLITRNRYYYVIKNLPSHMVFSFLINKAINIIKLILKLPFRLVFFNMNGFHADATKLKAHYDAIKNIPKMFRKRNEIRSKRMISDRELVQWFIKNKT
jgi:GT2 family glycosyltransferase